MAEQPWSGGGLGALGYILGREVFGGRRREEEALKDLLEQIRQKTSETETMVTPPAPTPQRATWGNEALFPQGGPVAPAPPPSYADMFNTEPVTGGYPMPSAAAPAGLGFLPPPPERETFTGLTPPQALAPVVFTGREAFQPGFQTLPVTPETPVPPVETLPVTPETPRPRFEPLVAAPPSEETLGGATAYTPAGPPERVVTRTTRPGRELLDVIAQNPKMLEVLKANPALLPLILQEQENQAWRAAMTPGAAAPAVGAAPPVATGTAAAGPPGPQPATTLREETMLARATARREQLQQVVDRIYADPTGRAANSPNGKAYLARYEKAVDDERQAAESLRQAQKAQREATKEETPTEFGVDYARAKDELRDELGREPTSSEIGKRVREIRAKEEKPPAPTEIGAAYALAKEQLQKELGRAPTEGEVGGRVLELRQKAEKEKGLTESVLSMIHDTGTDPRTGQPASPELRAQATRSVQGRLTRAKEVAGAQAGAQQSARQNVKLQEEIGVDAERFADPDGVKPKSNMTRGEVYKNYIQVDSRERAALQGGKQLEAVFSDKVLAEVESLFPTPVAETNLLFQNAVRKGWISLPGWLNINIPGMKRYSKDEIIKLQQSLALLDRMDAVATMVARNYGETGNVATADTERVTKGWSGAATYPQFKAAIGYMRDIHQRGKDHMLATKRVRIPEVTTIPGLGTFEEVP